MIKRLVLIMFILAISLSGCSAARQAAPAQSSQGMMPEVAPQAPLESKSADNFATGASAPASVAMDQSAAAGNDQRLVIRNANLTIVVDDPGLSMSDIGHMADTMGGFVVGQTLFKTTTDRGVEIPEASITIRVPADKLNDALDQIRKLTRNPVKDILSENVSGQDVTKEYTDLVSRQKNLEQAEAQLREIMGSATKTEDVLAVYNQLTQIREQIEVIKGQIKYYQESAAMSAIAVQLKAQAAVTPLEIGGWQPVGVARDAVQALINTAQVLGNIVIWLVLYVLPVGLLIFIPLRLLWALFRRSRKNRKMQAPPAAPPAGA